jgi:GT2 family glycosyltransferase
MNISAIVLSFNSQKYIENCINNLAAALNSIPGTHEIHVIENGSVDTSPKLLATLTKRYPQLVFPIYSPTNLGTTVSRNLALRKAKGDYILVLDSDATATAESILATVKTLNDDPKCGLAVPGLCYPDGRFQLSVDTFPTVSRKIQRLLSLKSLERDAIPLKTTTVVDYAISAYWMLKRSVVDQVGLLDERIFYSPEDVDYCIRIWKAGYTIKLVPHVQVVHDAQEISRGKKLNSFVFRHFGGLIYYFRKHGYAFTAPRFNRM